jgi:hypothetical protein
MTELSEFLDRLFADGDVVFPTAPRRASELDEPARALLRLAHADCVREVAGPALPFRPRVALSAAEFLRQACWFLVSRNEPPEQVERALELGDPGDAADHLSADVVLRYLPLVERRARALAPDDLLSRRLADVLQRWPLSGVLSDVLGGPTTAPTFDDHPGLQMLYAERLAGAEKPNWLPPGKAREFVDLVRADLAPSRGDFAVINQASRKRK